MLVSHATCFLRALLKACSDRAGGNSQTKQYSCRNVQCIAATIVSSDDDLSPKTRHLLGKGDTTRELTVDISRQSLPERSEGALSGGKSCALSGQPCRRCPALSLSLSHQQEGVEGAELVGALLRADAFRSIIIMIVAIGPSRASNGAREMKKGLKNLTGVVQVQHGIL